MTLPIQLPDYHQAVKEAGEVSVKAKDCIINETLIMKLLNGEAV